MADGSGYETSATPDSCYSFMAKVAKYLRRKVFQAVQIKEDTYSEILLQSFLLLWLHGPCLANTEHLT